MAITMGHNFPAHTFSGSAGKNMRPTIPGYKRGGEVDEKIEHAIHEHEDQEHGGHHSRLKLKEGGKVDPRDHYGKKNHIDHDGEMHQSHVHYDKDGFQLHKKGGKA